MAKVTITATAHVRDGKLTDTQWRERILEVFGKNNTLLGDVRDMFYAGVVDKFARPFVEGGVAYVAVMRFDSVAHVVIVEMRDKTGKEVLGSAVYGKTKFFSCLDENDN